MKFFEKNKNIIFVLLLALLLRIFLSFFGALWLDQGTFIAWSSILVKDGLKTFYNGWSDYLPGYLYVLWFLGKLNTGVIPQEVLYKLPAIISDLATGLFIYKIIIKNLPAIRRNEKLGLIGASIYLFNPAVWANSSLWGQVDSLTALTSILAIYILDSQPLASAFILAFGTLIKPQTAFAFPVIAFLMLKNKWDLRKILTYMALGLVIFALDFVPFWNHGNLISFIYGRLGISLNQYPYTSINAFNFWGLFGFWKKDSVFFQILGYLLVLISTIFLSFKLWKTKNAPYLLLTFIFAGSFVFFTRMHERHLLPIFAPLTIVAIEEPLFTIPLVGFSLTYILNLYYSYQWISQDFLQVFSDFTVKLLSFLNVGFVALIFYALTKNLKLSWKKVQAILGKPVVRPHFGDQMTKSKKEKFPKPGFLGKNARVVLYVIMAFAFITRVFDLSSPPTMYFDEVYHAFTAKVILSADAAKAWEWWNTPPPGFAYEWTHPPIAKLGMALGMIIFGQNSFGWRIPGAILGVGSVFLVYLLAKLIFEDEVVGLFSAAAFSLDGLALVMSRIGMNDSYILFFALLSIYLFLKKRNFLSALSFGFALASKWSATWAAPILLMIFLQRTPWRKIWGKIWKTFYWFFIIVPAVYIGSYFDMFLTGHNFSIWWGMQEQMWWYHTRLVATHPYSSQWWSWPLLIRPIYLYTSNDVGGMVARIYAMGNPVIFWFGFVCILICLLYAYREKNKRLGLIVFSYFVMFAPWALSPRIMFLYHYLPAVPFLAIAIGYILRKNKELVLPFFVIALLIFVYYCPHWAGFRIPLWLDRSYYWFTSWR